MSYTPLAFHFIYLIAEYECANMDNTWSLNTCLPWWSNESSPEYKLSDADHMLASQSVLDLNKSHSVRPSSFSDGQEVLWGWPSQTSLTPDDYFTILTPPTDLPQPLSVVLEGSSPDSDAVGSESIITGTEGSHKDISADQQQVLDETSIICPTPDSHTYMSASKDNRMTGAVGSLDNHNAFTNAMKTGEPDTANLHTSQIKKNVTKSVKKASSSKNSRNRRQKAHHNQVEKRYRIRLNDEFVQLQAVLETSKMEHSDRMYPEDDLRPATKGGVLNLARQNIVTLEAENRWLRNEVKRLGVLLRSRTTEEVAELLGNGLRLLH